MSYERITTDQNYSKTQNVAGNAQIVPLSSFFKIFCDNLAVKNRTLISDRCGLITRRLNLKYWDIDSTTANRFYSGSYGRDTATGTQSDLDLLFKLPAKYYTPYNKHVGNGQSALLQSVRNALLTTYPATSIRADGQVVALSFTDDMTFEIVPVFEQDDKSFVYPDANNGGSWKISRPRLEIDAINQLDKQCNGNLKNLCKMLRAWKEQHNVPIKGLLIDTLAYNFMEEYEHRNKSFDHYGLISLAFFHFLSTQHPDQKSWLSPGANQVVSRIDAGLFENKGRKAKDLVLMAWKLQQKGSEISANKIWRALYGPEFPSA